MPGMTDRDWFIRKIIRLRLNKGVDKQEFTNLFRVIVEEADKVWTEDNQNTRDSALVECFWTGATRARGGEV